MPGTLYPKFRIATSGGAALLGIAGVIIVALTRLFAMTSNPSWLTFNYTPIGWRFRSFALALGVLALLGAIWSRPALKTRPIGRLWLRLVIAIACSAIAYEVAAVVVLVFVCMGCIMILGWASQGSNGRDGIDFIGAFDDD